MLTYTSGGDFTAQVGLYADAVISHMQEYASSLGNDLMINELFDVQETTEPELAIIGTSAHRNMKKWKGTRSYEDVYDLPKKIISFDEFDLAEQIDRKYLDDAKIELMKQTGTSLMNSYARTRDYMCAQFFRNADQSTFTDQDGEAYNWTVGADGQPVASNTHTSTSGYCSTLDNLSILELTGTNLETLCQKMITVRDDVDNPTNYYPRTLMVGPMLRKTALELIGSDGKPHVTNNEFNVYYGHMRLIVYQLYTKQSGKTLDPWCVMDDTARKDNLKWRDRIKAEMTDTRDFNTMSWSIGVYTRYAFGTYDFRWGQFSIPA